MSRPHKPHLSVVRDEPARLPADALELEIHREIDIQMAAERLFKEALRLRAIPRYPDIADYRADAVKRFEEAVSLMRETING